MNIATLNTLPNATFYSVFWDSGSSSYKACYRARYDRRTIDFASVDVDNWKVTEPKTSDPSMFGEDPRVFVYKGKTYVLDNYINDTHFIDFESKRSYKVNISGKNLTVLVKDDELFVVQWFAPLTVHKCVDFERQIYVLHHSAQEPRDQSLRGGTPGVWDVDRDTFWGLGHKTFFDERRVLKHIPFYWEISSSWEVNIKVLDDLSWGNNIVDPTCLVCKDREWYLLTAESMQHWFLDQDYDTNVYRLTDVLKA